MVKIRVAGPLVAAARAVEVGGRAGVVDRAGVGDDQRPQTAAQERNQANSAFVPSAGSANPMNAVFPASCKNAPNAAAP
jgi:hypothetical protein